MRKFRAVGKRHPCTFVIENLVCEEQIDTAMHDVYDATCCFLEFSSLDWDSYMAEVFGVINT